MCMQHTLYVVRSIHSFGLTSKFSKENFQIWLQVMDLWVYAYIIHRTVNDFKGSFYQRRATALRPPHIEVIYRTIIKIIIIFEIFDSRVATLTILFVYLFVYCGGYYLWCMFTSDMYLCCFVTL